MVRRNTKKQKNTLVLPVPFAGVVALVCTIGLSYTWLDCRCDALGDEIKALESTVIDLDKKYNREEYRWIRMKSPAKIKQALDRNGLVMNWPRDSQVVKMYGVGSNRHVLAESRAEHARQLGSRLAMNE